MATVLPTRLLKCTKGFFELVDTRNLPYAVVGFDIISYTWGDTIDPYDPEIDGVDWQTHINPQKLEDVKNLMLTADIQYLWVDCLCIKQFDDRDKSIELPRMYDYYKSANRCYVLMDAIEVWNPQTILTDLGFINHTLTHMTAETLASRALLHPAMVQDLMNYANAEWTFPMDKMIARSSAIDIGVLNCYSTCIGRVKSLFENKYFTRVWTFQEILLGKNIIMYGIDGKEISCFGALSTWMQLATDARDKAGKLRNWIDISRQDKTATVYAILGIIDDDLQDLNFLQAQVVGIHSARTDIINGGRHWWCENHKGVDNVFSAISLTPRECFQTRDIFIGLLGIFDGLFSQAEITSELMVGDIATISFTFFKQLSHKTGRAWTNLAVSSKDRGELDWIPVVSNSSKVLTTDCFAGVVNLGRLKPRGIANSLAITGILGTPSKYMRISINQGNPGFYFVFRGCNAGKKVKTGFMKKELIPVQDQTINVVGDQTGKILVQCATILGSMMDPHNNLIGFRHRMLHSLQPHWHVTDPNAKPSNWVDRCVSGTSWQNPHPFNLRPHNWSMNYNFPAIYNCGSRLHTDSTASISCQVTINCGCTFSAPYSMIFEAVTAVEGSSLGGNSAYLEEGRIISRDGVGLVQVGDIGRSFALIAFGGDSYSHTSYASSCLSTRLDEIVQPKVPWPVGRALVRDEFKHGLTDSMRDYGYVRTRGAGNLLVVRNNPVGQYKIVGVCIDEHLDNKKGPNLVDIR